MLAIDTFCTLRQIVIKWCSWESMGWSISLRLSSNSDISSIASVKKGLKTG